MLTAFTPLVHQECRMLILGSMPGVVSLQANQYYAHPRNQFWTILAELTQQPEISEYNERCDLLLNHQIALWDVLRYCERRGSLDQAIQKPVPNDFEPFFQRYSKIRLVYFNGAAAEKLFRRLVLPELSESLRQRMSLHKLPSTSPAHTMPYMEKLKQWQVISLPAGGSQ